MAALRASTPHSGSDSSPTVAAGLKMISAPFIANACTCSHHRQAFLVGHACVGAREGRGSRTGRGGLLACPCTRLYWPVASRAVQIRSKSSGKQLPAFSTFSDLPAGSAITAPSECHQSDPSDCFLSRTRRCNPLTDHPRTIHTSQMVHPLNENGPCPLGILVAHPSLIPPTCQFMGWCLP